MYRVNTSTTDEATSALDAESETLVNQALAAILRGNVTTISIAHRLSTIKRSELIICIGPEGRVAESGSYDELSRNPHGAFTKLMEWQMSGGEERAPPRIRRDLEEAADEVEAEVAQEEELEDQPAR